MAGERLAEGGEAGREREGEGRGEREVKETVARTPRLGFGSCVTLTLP